MLLESYHNILLQLQSPDQDLAFFWYWSNRVHQELSDKLNEQELSHLSVWLITCAAVAEFYGPVGWML